MITSSCKVRGEVLQQPRLRTLSLCCVHTCTHMHLSTDMLQGVGESSLTVVCMENYTIISKTAGVTLFHIQP